MRAKEFARAFSAVAAVGLAAGSASATWSIVMVDTRTGELALGSATCRVDNDLQLRHPVLLVGRGIAAAQSTVDLTGLTRQTILDGFILGTAPADILAGLAAVDDLHEVRQYGIIDSQGRTASFTGSGTPVWRGGFTGRIEQGAPGPADDIVYAIQGNVLAGEAVVLAAQSAIISTSGDLADRLLAGMMAARLTGGDGRCSCGGANPTGCGTPPNPDPSTYKSAHIGYLMISRAGDTDGPVSAETGFATGDYWLNENIAYKDWNDPDPVDLLAGRLDDWRAASAGRADAACSTLPRSASLAAGTETTLLVDLQAYPGVPVTVPTTLNAISTDPGVLEVVSVTPTAGGYEVVVRGAGPGSAELNFVATDAVGKPVVLMPCTAITIGGLIADLNGDGILDLGDIGVFVNAFLSRDPLADVNNDGVFDLGDIGAFVEAFLSEAT
ncbi:MAG: hypothetical protein ACI89L_001225 [Phycisphaerales bacterium]|jgi:hypothetical protein